LTVTVPVYVVLAIAAVTSAAYIHAARKILDGRPLFRESPRPRIHWGWPGALGVFSLFIMFQIMALIVYRALWGEVKTPGSVAGFALVMYMFNLVTLAVILLSAGRGGDALEALGFRSLPLFRALWTGCYAFLLFIPVQFVYGVVLHLVWSALTDRPFPIQETAESFFEASPAVFAVLLVVATLIAPFFEELVFRGFLQGGLEKSLGSGAGVAITAALFTVAHGGKGALQIFPVAIALGLFYRRTRSLPACMAFHFCINASAVAVVLLVRGASA